MALEKKNFNKTSLKTQNQYLRAFSGCEMLTSSVSEYTHTHTVMRAVQDSQGMGNENKVTVNSLDGIAMKGPKHIGGLVQSKI